MTHRQTATVASLLVALAVGGTATGQTLTWDAAGASPPDGIFDIANNWNPNQVPGVSSELLFSISETYTVLLDSSNVSNAAELHVSSGNVTLARFGAELAGLILAPDGGNSDADIDVSGGTLTIGEPSAPVVLLGDDAILFVGVTNNGTLNVVGASSQLTVEGTSRTHAIGGSGGQGTLNLTDGASADIGTAGTLDVGSSDSGSSMGIVTVSGGSTLHTGNLDIADRQSAATGSVTVTGTDSQIAQLRPGATLTIGSATGGAGMLTIVDGGTFTSGTGLTRVNATGTLQVGGPLTSSTPGTFNANGDLWIDGGTVNVASSGTHVTLMGDKELRIDESSTGAPGTLAVTNGGTFESGTGSTIVGLGGSLNVINTSFLSGSSPTFRGNGRVTVDGGAMTVRGPSARALISDDEILQVGQIENFGGTGLPSALLVERAGVLSTGIANVDDPGVIRIENGGALVATQRVNVLGGKVILDDGTLETNQLHLVGGANSFDFRAGDLFVGEVGVTGSEPLVIPAQGRLITRGSVRQVAAAAGSSIVVEGEGVEFGDEFTRFTTYSNNGSLFLTSATSTTLHSKGFIVPAQFTEMGGSATLNAPNGIALRAGDVLLGGGAINAKVAAAAGSRIDASFAPEFVLGDAAALDGFASAGLLKVSNATVTIQDANQAELGALTTIGESTFSVLPGNLIIPNGLVLGFGRGISGLGTVDTPDDPARPTIINGSVVGLDMTNQLTLTGYVKGLGNFDNVVFVGTHAPGLSTAMLHVGNIAYDAAAALEIEIGGVAAGAQYDQLLSTDTVFLDGILDVSLLGGYQPSAGDAFEIISAASGVDGMFTTTADQLPVLPGGLQWTIDYGANNVVLAVVSAGLPGDYNNDGTVDAADYTMWRDALGGPEGTLVNDSDGGTIGPLQYATWKANFGMTLPSIASLDSAGVPEPASAMMLLFASVAAFIQQRRAGRLFPSDRRREFDFLRTNAGIHPSAFPASPKKFCPTARKSWLQPATRCGTLTDKLVDARAHREAE